MTSRTLFELTDGMAFLEALRERAKRQVIKSHGTFARTDCEDGINATIEALQEIVSSRAFWDWVVLGYGSLQWADDVDLGAVKKGRIYAVQMLALVVRLLCARKDYGKTG